GADDAAAGAEEGRLQDEREGQIGRGRVVDGDHGEARHRDAGGGADAAHAQLVARQRRGGRGGGGEAGLLGGQGRHQRRGLALGAGDRVEPPRLRDDGRRGALGILVVDDDRGLRPAVLLVEHVTTVGGHHHLGSGALGGGEEVV